MMEAKLFQFMNSVSILKKNLFISNHSSLQKPVGTKFLLWVDKLMSASSRKSYSLYNRQLIQYKLTTAQSTPLRQYICSLFAFLKSEKYNFLQVHGV